MDVIKEFLGVDRIQEGYGMSEISAFHWACDESRYHVQPWVIPFVLDPDDERAAAAARRADRARRVLRPAAREPLGRHHLGRRDHHRLGARRAAAASRASTSRTTSCATARSRASRTTASPAPPPRRCTTRRVNFLPGDRGMSDFRVPLFLRGELDRGRTGSLRRPRRRRHRSRRPISRSTSIGCRSRARWRSRISTRSRSTRSSTCSRSSAARSTSRRTGTCRRRIRRASWPRTTPPRS